jgi:hypothetical protein
LLGFLAEHIPVMGAGRPSQVSVFARELQNG